MNKWLKRGLWAAAALPLVLVATWFILDHFATKGLKETLTRLRANGYATTLAELEPPAIPDEDNGAPDLVKALDAVNGLQLDYIFRVQKGTPFTALPKPVQDRVLKELETFVPKLALLDTALAKKGFRFDHDYELMNFENNPYVDPESILSSCLFTHAVVSRQTGNADEARRSVERLVLLAKAHARDPACSKHSWTAMFLHEAMDTVDECVTRESTTDELHAWLALVPAPSVMNGMARRCIRTTVAHFAQTATEMPCVNFLLPHSSKSEPRKTSMDDLLRPVAQISMSRYLDRLENMEGAFKLPYPQASPRLSAMDREAHNLGRLDFVSRLYIPYDTMTLDTEVLIRARLALVRTGLEFEIERIEKGAYPQKAGTIDPCTGTPLDYEAKTGLIRSAGLSHDPERKVPPWPLRHPPRKK